MAEIRNQIKGVEIRKMKHEKPKKNLLHGLLDCGKGFTENQTQGEVLIHKWLTGDEIEANDAELEVIKAGLIELQYLPKEASIEDMRAMFQREDSLCDTQSIGEFYQKSFKLWEEFTPHSTVAEEIKQQMLDNLKTAKAEALRKLDFKKWLPMESAFDTGNLHFHTMVQELCGLLNPNAAWVVVVDSEDMGRNHP